MGLITGIPNFFLAATPSASDFNDAAKAVVSQIGGTCYSESDASYVAYTGNISSNNLRAAPAIRNHQKAEPFGLFSLTVANDETLGPFACPIIVNELTISSADATYPNAGKIVFYLNNRPYWELSFQTGIITLGTPSFVASGFPQTRMSVGDWMESALVDVTWSAPGALHLMLHYTCITEHVR